jgi:alpha-L-rhamnosidase
MQARLTTAVNRRLTRGDGTYVDGIDSGGAKTPQATQYANACALAYGVVPEAHRGAVAAYVAGFGMSVPVSSAVEVLKSLAGNGRFDDMVRVLTDPSHDGWANVLARGGTFCWEVWEPSDANGDSMSHGWGSNVLVAIQEALLGVSPTSPGYASFDVSPPPTGLDWAGGTVPTPRGTIDVAWRRPTPTDVQYFLDLTVPPNASATVRVPAANVGLVTEGGRPISSTPAVRVLTAHTGEVVLQVGSGRFEFRSTPAI